METYAVPETSYFLFSRILDDGNKSKNTSNFVSNVSDLYSGSPPFESRLRQQLAWMKFYGFPLDLQANMKTVPWNRPQPLPPIPSPSVIRFASFNKVSYSKETYPQRLSPYLGEEACASQPGQLCRQERNLLVVPPMSDRPKSRGHKKRSLLSCMLVVGRGYNEPIPEKFTVTNPPEPMEEDKIHTQVCSASKKEQISLTRSRSWALLEEPPVVQPFKNFPAFHGTR
jgi:hypothetical protein